RYPPCFGKSSNVERNQRGSDPIGECTSISGQAVRGFGGFVRAITSQSGNDRANNGTNLPSHSTMHLSAASAKSGMQLAKRSSSPTPCSPQIRTVFPVRLLPSHRGCLKGRTGWRCLQSNPQSYPAQPSSRCPLLNSANDRFQRNPALSGFFSTACRYTASDSSNRPCSRKALPRLLQASAKAGFSSSARR